MHGATTKILTQLFIKVPNKLHVYFMLSPSQAAYNYIKKITYNCKRNIIKNVGLSFCHISDISVLRYVISHTI